MLPPGTGNSLTNSLISFFRLTMSLFPNSSWSVSLKSLSLVPLAFLLTLLTMSVARSKNLTIWTKSAYLHPLVVIAGLPILTPDGIRALLSPGTVFLLRESEVKLASASILPPSVPLLLISIKHKWLSEPPETIWYPLLCKYSTPAFIFLRTYVTISLLDFDILWTQVSKLHQVLL